ncbi:MAG: hypoxanthine phosphoribosyltransferase [Balneola sp.]|jgi:hypoxanthine phosphoribosyltransferase|nr:hypoxanthine phosphoribosyltransferase [Balneola sp.]MBE78101.1 hypoxanthine phosphoribosyltransferase [Balneola sp.]HBX66828.1 hypoxanthine phosphoribosyltransferase [Balneolaceae bacterium]|tara:strand:+ start:148 stop:714 length:567 start_codon:yes stop_codon:yes gene_type:complete
MSSSFYQPDTLTCNGENFKIFITKEQIDERMNQLGNQLDKKYEGKKPIFIGILNGAFIFLSDLMRHVSIDCEVDFMKLSSYGDKKVSSGEVTELKHIDAKIEGRHVILVEDIVDTGLSMNYMVKRIKENDPASVAVCTLLHKKAATKYEVQLDFVGFEIPDAFVLGYGLDYAQLGRNLSQIYVIDKDE